MRNILGIYQLCHEDDSLIIMRRLSSLIIMRRLRREQLGVTEELNLQSSTSLSLISLTVISALLILFCFQFINSSQQYFSIPSILRSINPVILLCCLEFFSIRGDISSSSYKERHKTQLNVVLILTFYFDHLSIKV